jgi:hypothetical protein
MKTTTGIGRRAFIGMTVAAGLAPLTAKASMASSLLSHSGEATSWAGLTYEQMQAMIGQTFDIEREGQAPVRLELVQVDRLPASSRPAWLPRRQPFNARFRAFGEIDAPSLDNATVRHRRLGASRLLLSEVPTRNGVSIESVFA